jgi:hypothetical protein
MAVKFLNGIEGTFNLQVSDIPDLRDIYQPVGNYLTSVPNLDASKITSGTFSTSRIPNLDASKITSGTLNAARIPDLSATYATASHSHSISNVTGLQTALDGKQAAGNYFTDGDTVLNMANNDGLVYDDTTNRMYVKLDGTNREIYHTGNFTDSSANWNTAYGWGNHALAGYLTSIPSSYTTDTELAAVDTALNARIDNEVLPVIGEKLDSASYTAADVLTKIKTVDGSGSGLDADLLDGVNSSSFLRKDTDQTITNTAVEISFYSADDGGIATGDQATLEVYQDTIGADAFMQFHVGGDYAAYFGLAGDWNDFFVGGWSMGAVRYKVFHQGNLGVGDGGLTEKNFTATLKTKLDGIAANANNYSLPAGSSTVRGGFKIGYSENGKNYPVEVSSEQMYVNVPWTDTTYSVGDGGLTEKNFTSTLKTKLDGIATGANNYVLPVASTTIGGVKSGTDITVDANGNVSVNNNSHTHLWANITSRPTTLAGYGITDAEPLGAAADVDTALRLLIENVQTTADGAATAAANAQSTADGAETLATDAKTRALDAQTAAAAAQATADAALPKAGGTMTGELQLNARLDVGDGTNGDHEIRIYKADNNVSDHIQFYNGTTRVGEIGCEDTSWLRINQETAINIYTPRYIRADGGFFVDGTTKGIDGSGNFIGGTITGASDANVSNWDTAYTTTQSLGSAAFTSANDYAPISHTTGLTGGTYPIALGAGGFADGAIANEVQGMGVVIADSVNQSNTTVGGIIEIQKNNGDNLYIEPGYISSWRNNYTSGFDFSTYGFSVNNFNSNAYSQSIALQSAGQDFFQINVSGSTVVLFDQGTFDFSFADNHLKVNPATQQFSVFGWAGNNGMYFSPATATLQVPDVTIVSDRNAKENIEEIASGLDVVCKLQGVEYDMKSTKHHASGFIAQDVQEVIPHAVVETETGLTMKYNSIIAYQNEAIKELKAMVDELKEELKTLKNG